MSLEAVATWLWGQFTTDYVHGLPAMVASAGALASAFAISALIELAGVGWANSSIARLLRAGQSARCDLVTALFLQTPLIGHLGVLLSGGLSLYVIHAHALGLHPLWHGGAHPWLHALGCLVAIDALYYALHRLQHRWEPLWQLHRFHHVAEEATLLTALRVHPLEGALCGICLALPLGLLGGDGNEVPAIFLGSQVLAMLRHSNLGSDWGLVGRYLLVSPAAHHVHHAADPACYDRNFGVLLPWWDRVFGTWREPAAAPAAIGVPGDPLAEMGWWAGVWACYIEFWAALTRPWLALAPRTGPSGTT